MSASRFNTKTILYVVPYVLISTFQYSVAQDGLKYSSPFVLMGLRYLIAALVLFGVLRSFKPILNKDTILLSLLTAGSGAFWIFGLLYVSTSESAVLSYTMPLIAIPMSTLVLSERASRKEWAGASVGFLGAIVYSFTVFQNRTLSVFGAVLTVINAFFWGMYTIYYRKLKDQDPTLTVASQFLFCAVLFLLMTPLDYTVNPTSGFFFDVIYLSTLAGVASFLLWNALARLEKVGKSSTLIYSTPAAVTAVQCLETSTLPPPISIVGICVMIFGIYVSRM